MTLQALWEFCAGTQRNQKQISKLIELLFKMKTNRDWREKVINKQPQYLVSKTVHSSACVNNTELKLDEFNTFKTTELIVTCIIEQNVVVKMGLGLNFSSLGWISSLCSCSRSLSKPLVILHCTDLVPFPGLRINRKLNSSESCWHHVLRNTIRKRGRKPLKDMNEGCGHSHKEIPHTPWLCSRAAAILWKWPGQRGSLDAATVLTQAVWNRNSLQSSLVSILWSSWNL